MKEIKRPKNRFDKRFDKLRNREVFGYNPKQSSNRALKKLQSNRLAVIGLIYVVLTISASIFAPFVTKYDPQKVDLRSMLKPPSSEHILGTDKIGRDVFARIIYGGRISILVGLGSALGAASRDVPTTRTRADGARALRDLNDGSDGRHCHRVVPTCRAVGTVAERAIVRHFS